jgi:hypothetical protein
MMASNANSCCLHAVTRHGLSRLHAIFNAHVFVIQTHRALAYFRSEGQLPSAGMTEYHMFRDGGSLFSETSFSSPVQAWIGQTDIG